MLRTLWQGKQAHVLGSRIFYREEGSRANLLLLHGWTGNSFQWRRMLPDLAKRHHVIALDVPGCGLSEKPRIDYTLPDYLGYIRAFVEKIGFRPFALVGTSFGGFLATRYCLQHPEDVRELADVRGHLLCEVEHFFHIYNAVHSTRPGQSCREQGRCLMN